MSAFLPWSNRVSGALFWRAALVCALAVPAVAGAAVDSADPAEAMLPSVAADSWVEVRTPRIVVMTDAGEALGTSLERGLEQLMDTFAALNPGLRTVPAQPIELYLVKGTALAGAFMPRDVENITGVALPGRPGRNAALIQSNVEGAGKAEVVSHEFTHILLFNNFSDLPVCLNEGLAQYYGTFRARGATAEVGKRYDGMVEWVKANEHTLVPLDVLLTMDEGAPAYRHDNYLREAAYAEGWTLVHWLQSDAARAAKFAGVLEAMKQGANARTAFAREFPESEWPKIVESLGAYPRESLIDAKQVPLPRAASAIAVSARPVGAAEALRRMGDLLCDVGEDRRVTARRYYAESLARDSSVALAWAGAGFAADACGDSVAASRSYARASELASDDARVALRVALGLHERLRRAYRQGNTDQATVAPLAKQARDAYARVLQLDDQDPEALAGFGTMFLMLGQMPEAGYHALAMAADALPGRPDVQSAFAAAREARKARDAGAGDAAH